MYPGVTDIQRTRVFGREQYLLRQVPYAAGLLLLGSVISLVVPDHMWAAVAIMAVSAVFIGYALYRQSVPAKPIFQFSPEGILYSFPAAKEVFIPWRDVQGVESIEIGGNWLGLTFRNVTAVLVTKDFYNTHIFIDSAFERGLYWAYRFIPKGEMIQVAVHHELLGVPAAELLDVVESRWRAFSGHPDAILTSKAERRVAVRPTRTLTWAALAFVAVLAVPAIYFWQWPAAWLSFPVPPQGSLSAYLGQLLDGTGVPARLGGGPMTKLHRSEVLKIGPSTCVREIARDASGGASLVPSYAVTAYCTANLQLQSGAEATAIFKLVAHTSYYEDWDRKRRLVKSIVIAPLDPEEADTRLCQLGSCAR